MSGTITIVGLTSDDKVPGFYRQTTYGAGASSVGANPLKCLLWGNKTAAGTATADADIKQILSQDDADTYFGAGSELAMMASAALMVPGVNLYMAANAESAGTQATWKVTVGGAWTTSGSITLWLAGQAYQVSVASTDVANDVATNINAAFNAVARSPVTSGVVAPAVTLTTKQKGPRQNDWVVDYDLSLAPAGLTFTIDAGTALTGNAAQFKSGATADSLTNLLALLTTDRYDRIGSAQYDGTAITAIKNQLDSEAGPLVAHLEHVCFGSALAAATANTLSATTINHARCQNTWLLNSQWPPSMIAAYMAALRSVVESSNPNFNYDGYKTPIPAQRYRADWQKHAALKSALNSGVTPLLTTPDGTVVIVRSIVTKCKTGSSYDYRTLDTGDAVVPDYVSDQLAAQWQTFAASNPYAGPDPQGDERPAVEGVGTPALWNAEVYSILKQDEKDLLTEAVDDNLPESVWDTTSKRILTACPVVVRSQNHQGGADVRQTVAP